MLVIQENDPKLIWKQQVQEGRYFPCVSSIKQLGATTNRTLEGTNCWCWMGAAVRVLTMTAKIEIARDKSLL